MNKTKRSQYLLDQEHITDKELDDLYSSAEELQIYLDRFRQYDNEYRALEEVNTQESETRRTSMLNRGLVVLGKIDKIVDDMSERGEQIRDLFIKAKGALEEKRDLREADKRE